MAAKKAFLLVFFLMLIVSINSVLGDVESTIDQMKEAGEGVKGIASSLSDWFKKQR